MTVKGTIKEIGTTETVGANDFKKRTIVVTEGGTYLNDVAIEFVQDKTSVLDMFAVNQEVEIGINIRSNNYNGKWYTSVQGWKIDKI